LRKRPSSLKPPKAGWVAVALLQSLVNENLTIGP
jgi:hypothetical protein